MTPKSRIRTDGFAILGGDTKGRGDASTSPAVDAHPKEVNAVTNSSKSSPIVSPEPNALPVFLSITEQLDVIYRELIQAYASPNEATKWSVRRQALDALEREQERVTRIHEAFYRGMERRVTDPARQGEEATR